MIRQRDSPHTWYSRIKPEQPVLRVNGAPPLPLPPVSDGTSSGSFWQRTTASKQKRKRPTFILTSEQTNDKFVRWSKSDDHNNQSRSSILYHVTIATVYSFWGWRTKISGYHHTAIELIVSSTKYFSLRIALIQKSICSVSSAWSTISSPVWVVIWKAE